MLIYSTLLMAVFAGVLLWKAHAAGHGLHIAGAKAGLMQFAMVLPLLIATFLVLGLIKVLVSPAQFASWMGAESGMRGIAVGCVAGAVAPGGPIVQSIIAGGLLKAGAGVGSIVAFLTSGVLWGIMLLPDEIGLLGWRVVMIRIASTFFVPPMAGLIAHFFFGTKV